MSDRLIAIFFLFVLVLLFAVMQFGGKARAQTHDEIHEQTKDWKRPSDGMGCCHDNDCRGTVAEIREDGRWWVFIGHNTDGTPDWRVVPDKAFMPTDMPPHNGRTIVCERWGQIYCFRPAQAKF